MAKERNLGLINASGLHMGVLTEGGPPDWHPAPPEVLSAGRIAAEICREHNTGIANVALRFCLDHPYVASTLVGMATRAHVEANLDLLRIATDPALIQEIRSAIPSALNYVWPSGRAENYG